MSLRIASTCNQVFQQPGLLEKERLTNKKIKLKNQMTDKKDRNTDKLTDKQTMKENAIKQKNKQLIENIKLSKGESRPGFPTNLKLLNKKTWKCQKVKVDLDCTIPPPPQLLWQDSHCVRCRMTWIFPLNQFVGFFFWSKLLDLSTNPNCLIYPQIQIVGFVHKSNLLDLSTNPNCWIYP